MCPFQYGFFSLLLASLKKDVLLFLLLTSCQCIPSTPPNEVLLQPFRLTQNLQAPLSYRNPH